MSMIKWQAADKFSYVAEEMSRWMDRVLGPEFHRYRPKQAWSPAINVYEDDVALYLVVDLAGVEPESIDLNIQRQCLTLKGERAAPRPPQSPCVAGKDARSALRLHTMEIDHGSFLRSLDLPEAIDNAAVEACYRNGFLWVKLPKKTPVKTEARRPQ